MAYRMFLIKKGCRSIVLVIVWSLLIIHSFVTVGSDDAECQTICNRNCAAVTEPELEKCKEEKKHCNCIGSVNEDESGAYLGVGEGAQGRYYYSYSTSSCTITENGHSRPCTREEEEKLKVDAGFDEEKVGGLWSAGNKRFSVNNKPPKATNDEGSADEDDKKSDEGLSIVVIICIAVGGVVFLCCIVGICIFFCLRSRRNNQTQYMNPAYSAQPAYPAQSGYGMQPPQSSNNQNQYTAAPDAPTQNTYTAPEAS